MVQASAWDEGSSRRRAHSGLRWAHARFADAIESEMDDRIYCSAVEMTIWACALDEILGMSDGTYKARRDQDADGRRLVGLRWARNRGVHSIMNLHQVQHGETIPVRIPVRYWDIHWLPRDRIPTPQVSKPIQERAYDDYLAGESVEVTLAVVNRFLTGPSAAGESYPELRWRP